MWEITVNISITQSELQTGKAEVDTNIFNVQPHLILRIVSKQWNSLSFATELKHGCPGVDVSAIQMLSSPPSGPAS